MLEALALAVAEPQYDLRQPMHVEEPERWRKRVAQREIAYHVLIAIDTWQTMECQRRPNCYEMNPILGKHPSDKEIIGYMALSSASHYAVTRILMKVKPELVDEWQWLSIGFQGGVVAANLRWQL